MPLYAPSDETIHDWASRHLENAVQLGGLSALRDATPQTESVPEPEPAPTLSMILRRIADALEAQEVGMLVTADATAMLDEVPEELRTGLMALLGLPDVGYEDAESDRDTMAGETEEDDDADAE